jgi:hypothetical protein
VTIQDLIDIARDEGRDPATLELVMGIGGYSFNVETTDDQDPFNPTHVMMTLQPRTGD